MSGVHLLSGSRRRVAPPLTRSPAGERRTLGRSLRGGIARQGFSVNAAVAGDELEDDVAIAVGGAHHDHHRIAVPYFAAGTIAGGAAMMLAVSLISVPPSSPPTSRAPPTPQRPASLPPFRSRRRTRR